jgi:hypothetical protein
MPGKRFYFRDLSAFAWPFHQYLRRCWLAGEPPIWDAGFGLGYPVLADPNPQPLMPVTLVLRLALPEAIGFGLWVALAPSVAGLGAYLFGRRYYGRSAAALGALVFALSGPMLSAVNTTNLSWSAALVGWVLWSVDRAVERSSPRRVAAAAAAFGLQALCGEPVTLVATAVLALCWGAFGAPAVAGGLRDRAKAAMSVTAAGLVGALLAAVQLLPLIDVASRSLRAIQAATDVWRVHPLSLLETVAPLVFGSNLDPVADFSPWLFALNDGRDAFLTSLYVGSPALLLALAGAFARGPRRNLIFWLVAGAVLAAMAVGPALPVLTTVQSVLPFSASFRFPAKYMVVATFALAPLAAAGLESCCRDLCANRWPPVLCAAAALSTLGLGWLTWTLTAPGAVADVGGWLASGVGGPSRLCGLYSAGHWPTVAARLSVVSCATLVLLLTVRGGLTRVGTVGLLVLVPLDLLIANGCLNPAIDATRLEPAAWIAKANEISGARVYVPQRGLLPLGDPERPAASQPVPGASAPELLAVYGAAFPLFPSLSGPPEAISVDLSKLRAAQYSAMVDEFRIRDTQTRNRFLHRAGVRLWLSRGQPVADASVVFADPATAPFLLWHSASAPARVLTPAVALVEADASAAARVLFDAGFDPATFVLVDTEPAPAGVPGDPEAAGAAVVEESQQSLTIEAYLGGDGGYVLLLDAWDPYWRAEVDGTPATVVLANGLFRAVRVAAGRHTVRFYYRPLPLYIGLAISLMALLGLILACWRKDRFDGAGASPVASTPPP